MTVHVRPCQDAPAAGAGELLLDVRGLRIAFDGAPAGAPPVVDGLDLSLRRGRVLAIVGESGSGKSVSARSLLGLAGAGARVAAERFDVLGRDARRFGEADWRRLRGRRIGLVLQDALTSLDPMRTIGAEVSEALDAADGSWWPRRRAAGEIETLLASVGIRDPGLKRRQYAHQLSGGQRQRALIASAIAGDPDVIIADEPTTALDVTIQARILQLLKEKVGGGRGLILISHDFAVVADIADDVIVLNRGRMVEAGPAREVLYQPQRDYTRQLIAAIPGLQSRGKRLSALPQPAATVAVAVEEGPTVVRAEGLVKWYRGEGGREFKAVDGVSFSIRAREIVGLVGESGSGKSTVAKLVTGLLAPDAGTISIYGASWPGETKAARRAGVGTVQLIGQDSLGSFDPRYTVREVVAESVALVHRDRGLREKRVRELLDLVQLPAGTIDRHPRELSGGQRQRVSIARALGSNPKVLVCDEPVSALDVSVQAQILDLFVDIRSVYSASFLFISHDIGVINHLCDKTLVMLSGRIVDQGPSESLFGASTVDYTQQLMRAVPHL
jgi:peptide/nickel transport system ATP-binding protein